MDKEKKSKRAGLSWLGIVLYMILGGLAAILNMRLIFKYMHLPVWARMLLFFLLLLLVYAAMFLQIVIHESGHLVFGLATGYRFSSFRIHNWMWILEDGKLRLTRLSIPGTGGQCLMAPPDLKDGKIPVLLYNFGGAIMNLLTAAVFFLLALPLAPTSVLKLFLQQLALFGVGIGLMNGIPLHIAPVENDGCNAMTLMRNKKAIPAFWLQMKVNELVANGTRLRDMPEEWFTVPEDEEMNSGIMAAVGVLASSRLMDQHRFAVADALMGHLLSIKSGMTDLHRSLMTCDRIYLELIGQNRKEVLDAMLTDEQKELMKAMTETPSVLRTEFAYALLVECDAEKAEKIEKKFEKCALTYPYPSEIPGERELMQIAREHVIETDEESELPEAAGEPQAEENEESE